jgi:hypothetical protein
MKLRLVDNNEKIINTKDFGIAGAMVFKAFGPFLDPMKKEPNPNHPNPHGEGCILPTVECMVNNEVYLEKEYINETTFDFKNEYPVIINAYEDLIPIEKEFSVQGQCCFYLEEEIIVEEALELWMVLGNNDGFTIWANNEKIISKDEIRYWTPYNNCELVKLKKGKNRIVIKLLRRTEQLKFSFGLRNYDGEHWHRKQWFTDFKVGL